MRIKSTPFLLAFLIFISYVNSYANIVKIAPPKVSRLSNGTIQCNTDAPIPLANGTFSTGTFDDLTATSTSSGLLCLLGCGITNVPNVIDSDISNFATASSSVAVGITHTLKVKDGNDTFAAGTFAGFRIASSGVLSLDVLNSITIKTYQGNSSTPIETISGSSLLSLGLLSTDKIIGFNTTQPFNAIEISINPTVSVLSSVNIYYAVIRSYCAGPVLSPCGTPNPAIPFNTPVALNLPIFPAGIVNSHTITTGIGSSVTNAENAVTSSTTDYASLTPGVLGSASLAVKDQVATTDYPAGTYAGFSIESSGLLNVNALGAVTITTYLNGTQQENKTGNNDLVGVNTNLLAGTSRQTVGFVTTLPFDEIQITTTGVSLGETRVYNAVIETFCTGPDLACNVQTPINAPTYPVFINSANTGIDGLLCALCTVSETENLIDNNPANFASINLTASVGGNGKISVKDQITNYPAGTFAGFDIESTGLLNVNALNNITVNTYLEGVLQETKTGNSALISVNTNLLVSTDRKTIGFVSTLPFDEVQISVNNTALVTLGTIKVYSALLEKFCLPIVECNKTYILTSPDFPVTIDDDLTGGTGVACVACAVNDINNVLTASTTDFAQIKLTAGVLATGAIAVKDQLFTYPSGTFAGFKIEDVNTLIQLNLLQSLTVSTYNDGVLQETKPGGQLIDLTLLNIPILGSGPGIYNVGFQTTLPFDEIRLSVNSIASVINTINVYGAFVDTHSSNGGGLTCNADLGVTKTVDNPTPVVGTNVTFTITATNNGPNEATGVSVTDTLPAGYTFVSATPSVGAYNGTTWTIGTLANGTSATLTVVAKVNPNGPYANTAVISGTQSDPTPENNTATSTPIPVNIIIAQDDTINGGNGATGSSNAGNVLNNNSNGNDTLNGSNITIVQVNLTVPTPATPIGGGPVPTIDPLTGQIVVPVGTPAGIYTLVYQICEKQDTDNCDSATVTITVTNSDLSDLAITKTVDDETPVFGTNVTFTITAINNGPNNATGVSVTDALPSGYTFVSANPSVGAYDNTTGIWTISNLVSGASATLTVVATVNTTGLYANTAVISGTESDPTPGNNTATSTPTPVNEILAQDDTINAGNGTSGNSNAGNVIDNDTFNGSNATTAQVGLTVLTPATSIGGNPVPTIDSSGQITVPTGTPAGTYTLVYQICEILNSTNCDSATVTVTVTPPVIDAQNDTVDGGNGTAINPNAGNVLNNNGNGNDTLNGSNITIAQVKLSVTTPATPIGNNPVPEIDPLTGQISVPAGTPAGTYTLGYQICEKLNPDNCDGATVTVTITTPVIDAQDDTINGGNGTTGNSNAGNVLDNDTLNGTNVTIAQVNFTVTTPATPIGGSNPVPEIDPLTGQITVPAGTPAGTYTLVYQICEKPNPDNCDSATVTVTITAPVIDAQDDTINGGNGTTVNPNAGNVLDNDTLNGTNVTIAQVNFTVTTPATSIGGNPVPTINPSTGQISVPAGTPAGTYTLVYQICEKLNPTNCDSATVSVAITTANATDLGITKTVDDQTPTVGTNVTFTITATNNGPNNATGVTVTEALPSGYTFVSASTSAGLYTAPTWAIGNLNNGATATLTIVAKVNATGNYSNTATITGGQPDPSLGNNTATSTPTPNVIDVEACETLVVHNSFSPNGDGKNEKFIIDNIEDSCYVNNTVEIYNRWGVLVFETKNYDNDSNYFDGTSRGRVTVNQSAGLPAGTYFYILNYTTSENGNIQSHKKDGYLYLTR